MNKKTLEEVAERYAKGKSSSSVFQETHKRDFIEGANYQAERMYIENVWIQAEKELPEIGELCLVRDDESMPWRVREFAFEYNGTFNVKSICGSTDSYVHMKRIKILD